MERYRGFQCYFSWVGKTIKNKEVLKELKHSRACWAGLPRERVGTEKFGYRSMIEKEKVGHPLYIAEYRGYKHDDNIPLLLSVINEITPCVEIGRGKNRYIKYTLLDTYDRNLVLLNFIRNLWNDGNSRHYCNDKFFECLNKLNEIEGFDPIMKLTIANKHACADVSLVGDHSNTHSKSRLKVRTVKEFKEWVGSQTSTFLCDDKLEKGNMREQYDKENKLGKYKEKPVPKPVSKMKNKKIVQKGEMEANGAFVGCNCNSCKKQREMNKKEKAELPF